MVSNVSPIWLLLVVWSCIKVQGQQCYGCNSSFIQNITNHLPHAISQDCGDDACVSPSSICYVRCAADHISSYGFYCNGNEWSSIDLVNCDTACPPNTCCWYPPLDAFNGTVGRDSNVNYFNFWYDCHVSYYSIPANFKFPNNFQCVPQCNLDNSALALGYWTCDGTSQTWYFSGEDRCVGGLLNMYGQQNTLETFFLFDFTPSLTVVNPTTHQLISPNLPVTCVSPSTEDGKTYLAVSDLIQYNTQQGSMTVSLDPLNARWPIGFIPVLSLNQYGQIDALINYNATALSHVPYIKFTVTPLLGSVVYVPEVRVTGVMVGNTSDDRVYGYMYLYDSVRGIVGRGSDVSFHIDNSVNSGTLPFPQYQQILFDVQMATSNPFDIIIYFYRQPPSDPNAHVHFDFTGTDISQTPGLYARGYTVANGISHTLTSCAYGGNNNGNGGNNDNGNRDSVWSIIGPVIAIVVIAILLIVLIRKCGWCIKRKMQKQRELVMAARAHEHLVEIPPSELKLGKVIGEGYSGVVFKAMWRGTEVAVKKTKTSKEENLVDFENEEKVARALERHPRIVPFLGWYESQKVKKRTVSRPATMASNGGTTKIPYNNLTLPGEDARTTGLEDERQCLLVMYYLPYGSLEDVLIVRQEFPFNFSSRFPDDIKLRHLRLITQMVVDASAGILHCHSQGVVHRDIAARNFLVDTFHRVYVADFGISRILAKGEDSGMADRAQPIPIAWSAPESIRTGTYSKKTDVYMFGVFLTETLTRTVPYPGMKIAEAGKLIAEGRLRPKIPDYCPREWHELIVSCTAEDPAQRPDFAHIVETLNKYLELVQNASELSAVYHPVNPPNLTAGVVVDTEYEMPSKADLQIQQYEVYQNAHDYIKPEMNKPQSIYDGPLEIPK